MENQPSKSIQERVNDICNDLFAKGTKPSVRLVLSMLPDVSSTSTVHKYFSVWKDEQAASQASLYDKLGFSQDFTHSFMKEITRFSIEAEQIYREKSEEAIDQKNAALEELVKIEISLLNKEAVIEQANKVNKELEKELFTVQVNHKQLLISGKNTHEALIAEVRKQLEDATVKSNGLLESNEILRTNLAKDEIIIEGNTKLVDEVKGQSAIVREENATLSKAQTSLSKEVSRLEAINATLEATRIGNEHIISNNETHQKSLNDSLAIGEQQRQELAVNNKQLIRETEVLARGLSMEKASAKSDKVLHEKELVSLNQKLITDEKLIFQLELSQTSLEKNKLDLEGRVQSLKEEITDKITK